MLIGWSFKQINITLCIILYALPCSPVQERQQWRWLFGMLRGQMLAAIDSTIDRISNLISK